MALSSAIPPALNKKIGELSSTNTRDHVTNVACSAYGNAFATGGISTFHEFPPIGLTTPGGLTLGFAPNF